MPAWGVDSQGQTCDEEAVHEADLHAAEQRRHANAVRRQVGQEAGDQGGRRHWGLRA